MKVLVTGGAGFIGSHTVDLLLQTGYQVRILDALLPPVHQDGRVPDYVPQGAEFLQGDVCRREDMDRALHRVDFVLHLAAYQDYLPHFSRFAAVNDVSTALLYELLMERKHPIRKVVLASSQAVYGEGKYWCPQHGVHYPEMRSLQQLTSGQWDIGCASCGQPMQPLPNEEGTAKPHNQYAISKYAQELYALVLGKRYGIPTVVLRYSIAQGPRQSFRNAYSGVCRSFTVRLLTGRRPVIYEDGRQLRDYIYVGDVARANLLALEDSRADYQVFNVGGGRAVTVLEYARLVAQRLGKRVEPELTGAFRVGDARHAISDIAKLRALGWEPQTPVEKIIDEYAAWAAGQPHIQDYYAEAEQVMARLGALRQAQL